MEPAITSAVTSPLELDHRKLLSPSEDFKKEDLIMEYKVSEPSTLHLAGPSVVCCGSSAQHNRTIFATRWC